MIISKKLIGSVIASGVATAFALTAIPASAATTSTTVTCPGANACKGSSSCKGSSGCKSQNNCKSASKTQVTTENCAKTGGKVDTTKSSTSTN